MHQIGLINSAKNADTMLSVNKTIRSAKKSDIDKQAEINKKDKADRATAKSMMDRSKLEKSAGAKPKRERMKTKKQNRPGIIKKPKNESMDFTEFLNATVAPLYEKEGEIPKCPPGYTGSTKEMMMCVPKTKKDAVGSNQKGRRHHKDLRPGNGAGYNVWGTSGYDGAGYAWEEQPTSNDKSSGSFE